MNRQRLIRTVKRGLKSIDPINGQAPVFGINTTKQIKTHIITNLNASELEDRYGNSAGSRMLELFNLIAFDEKAGDKRK